jgi:hypothetical protein
MSTSQQAPVIFYSWQSDSNPKTNNHFIKNALEKAIKAIRKEGVIEVAPRLDHDVKGVAGSPNIAETIFRKIDASQIFVCDISLVTASKVRKFSNPNVLVELGYALRALANERIIMVINTAKYSEKDLPFDLRQLRVLRYKLPESLLISEDPIAKDEVKKIQQELENALKQAIRGILNNVIVADVIPDYIALAVKELNKPDINERKQGIVTLARSETAFAKNALLEALKHDLPDVRVEAAIVLVTQDKDLAALPVLEKALINSEVDTNTQIEILGTMKDLGEDVIDILLNVLAAKKDDRKIASYIVGIAAGIGTVNALAIPLHGLGNRDIEIKKASLDTIGKIFTEDFVRKHIRYKQQWEENIDLTITVLLTMAESLYEDRLVKKKAWEILKKLSVPRIIDGLNRLRGTVHDPTKTYKKGQRL